jgi:hypothetical protein
MKANPLQQVRRRDADATPCFQWNDFRQSNARIIALARTNLLTFSDVTENVDRLARSSSCKTRHSKRGELAARVSLTLFRATMADDEIGRYANRETCCKERVRDPLRLMESEFARKKDRRPLIICDDFRRWQHDVLTYNRTTENVIDRANSFN